MRAQVKPTNTEGLENLFYCSGICVCYILFFSFSMHYNIYKIYETNEKPISGRKG